MRSGMVGLGMYSANMFQPHIPLSSHYFYQGGLNLILGSGTQGLGRGVRSDPGGSQPGLTQPFGQNRDSWVGEGSIDVLDPTDVAHGKRQDNSMPSSLLRPGSLCGSTHGT